MIYRYFFICSLHFLSDYFITIWKHKKTSTKLSFGVPLHFLASRVHVLDTRGQWLYMWHEQRIHAASAVLPWDSLAAVNDEVLSCLQLTLHTSSLEQARLNPLHYRHFSFPHTHTTHTSRTHENKQSSFKPAGFTLAEGEMKSIFWELCCVWNVIIPNRKTRAPFPLTMWRWWHNWQPYQHKMW